MFLFGKVPALADWSYSASYGLTPIISAEAALDNQHFPPLCPGDDALALSGILLFHNSVEHELRHVTQITIANAQLFSAISTVCLGINDCNPWQHGWSWNQRNNHNHFAPFGFPGIDGEDDDEDGSVDNYVCGRGELGLIDLPLYNLSDLTFEWPTALGPVAPMCPPWGPIEVDARHESRRNMADIETVIQNDWAAPGCQYRGEGGNQTDCSNMIGRAIP